MKIIKYLLFTIVSVSTVLGMIYLEQETSVVRSFKTTLGLDVGPHDPNSEDSPGLFETAQAYLDGSKQLPSLKALTTTRSAPDARKFLPEPTAGWMREVADFEISSVRDLHALLRQHHEGAAASRTKELGQDEAAAMEFVGDTDFAALGISVAGAQYFREDFQMRLTILSFPKKMGLAPQMMEMLQSQSRAAQADPSNSLEVNGRNFAVKRDAATGQRGVTVMTDKGLVVQLRGNVSNEVMKEYLDLATLRVTKPANVDPVAKIAQAHLLPSPLEGWSGEARTLSYEDVLDFDARFAPDGARVELSSEERAYLKAAENAGLHIYGSVLIRGDEQMMVTLSKIPHDGGNKPIGPMMIASGLMQETRAFRINPVERTELGNQSIAIFGFEETDYSYLGRIIGGVYFFQIRGNVSLETVKEVTASLDYDRVRAAAKEIYPEWE